MTIFRERFQDDSLGDVPQGWTPEWASTSNDWSALDDVTSSTGGDTSNAGDIIGGGDGYSNTISSGNYTVSSSSELSTALSNATAGEVIFIDSQINVGTSHYTIPGDVTVAGDRGVDGSAGPLVESEGSNGFEMSSGSRLTGIRFIGPWLNSDGDYGYPIGVDGVSAEVDNCEIAGFGEAGIYVDNGGDCHLHHCYTHDTNKGGTGYGINIGPNSNATVERNYMENHRHVIAANGNMDGYTYRYNHVAPTQTDENIDIHGQDGNAGVTSYIHNNIVEWYSSGESNVQIRGTPQDACYVYDNWLYNPNPPSGCDSWCGDAIIQPSTSGFNNVYFTSDGSSGDTNHYGSSALSSFDQVITDHPGPWHRPWDSSDPPEDTTSDADEFIQMDGTDPLDHYSEYNGGHGGNRWAMDTSLSTSQGQSLHGWINAGESWASNVRWDTGSEGYANNIDEWHQRFWFRLGQFSPGTDDNCRIFNAALADGSANSGGGGPPSGDDGWSERLYVTERGQRNSGEYNLLTYTYHMDQGGSYGTLRTIDNTGLTLDEWHQIDVYVKVNTYSGGTANADGIVRYWFNETLIDERTDLRFTTQDDNRIQWGGPVMFYGGSYDAPSDVTAWYDDHEIWVNQDTTVGGTTETITVDFEDDRGMELNSGTNARHAVQWSDVGTAEDAEILTAVYIPSIGTTASSHLRSYIRAGGTETDPQAYYCEVLDGEVGVSKYQNQSAHTLGTATPGLDESTWYYMRFRVEGGNLRLRYWKRGNTEPDTWDIDVYDDSFSSGWIGVGSYSGSAAYWDNITLGTAGQTAPIPGEPAESGAVYASTLTGKYQTDATGITLTDMNQS